MIMAVRFPITPYTKHINQYNFSRFFCGVNGHSYKTTTGHPAVCR